MSCCERLNGITRTMPRGTFEQTEFPNQPDCLNRRCRNLPLGWMSRANLNQLPQRNRIARNS
jgi:hypothetical protein